MRMAKIKAINEIIKEKETPILFSIFASLLFSFFYLFFVFGIIYLKLFSSLHVSNYDRSEYQRK